MATAANGAVVQPFLETRISSAPAPVIGGGLSHGDGGRRHSSLSAPASQRGSRRASMDSVVGGPGVIGGPVVTTKTATITSLSLPVAQRSHTDVIVSGSHESIGLPLESRRKSSFTMPATPDSRYIATYSNAISFGMPGPLPAQGGSPSQSPKSIAATQQVLLSSQIAPGAAAARTIGQGNLTSTVGVPQAIPAPPAMPPPAPPTNVAPSLSPKNTMQPSQQFLMQPPSNYMCPSSVMSHDANMASVQSQLQFFQLGAYMQMPGQGHPSALALSGYAPAVPMFQQQLLHQPPPHRQVHQLHISRDPESPEEITTVMLRNIPLKYTRETLLQDLDQRGFAETYDFFYLPMDFERRCSVGYAFINFLRSQDVARFRKEYQGMQLASDSAKVCEVVSAKVQGKHKNIQYYRNSSVMSMDEEYQPVIFEDGTRVPFPKPTQQPKPFRPRGNRPHA